MAHLITIFLCSMAFAHVRKRPSPSLSNDHRFLSSPCSSSPRKVLKRGRSEQASGCVVLFIVVTVAMAMDTFIHLTALPRGSSAWQKCIVAARAPPTELPSWRLFVATRKFACCVSWEGSRKPQLFSREMRSEATLL